VQASDGRILKERLEQLADALGSKCPSGKGLQVWFEVLKGYLVADVLGALDVWATEKTKFPAPAEIGRICAGFLSDRIEREAVHAKAEFGQGAARILGNPAIARLHLAKIWAIPKPQMLKGGDCHLPDWTGRRLNAGAGASVNTPQDAELEEERRCMALQDEPL